MARTDDARGARVIEAPRHEDELAPGTPAGDYTVDELRARGGCGAVYRAHHSLLHHKVALKVLHATLARLPKMVERFTREVEVVNRLRHPAIIDIHEIGALADGRPFYTMEYLEGPTLDALLRTRGRFSPDEVLGVLEPVCDALSAAHAAGIIHRDVKASNIAVIGPGPRGIKLLDFGIARLEPANGAAGLTSVGRRIGTLTIMAPEQLAGGPIDARIDVYALGVLAYRLLTGKLPFDGKTAAELARQHLEQPAPRPSQRAGVSRALDAVVLRCLEKRPERRFESVAAFLAALRSAVHEPEVRLRRAGAPARAVAAYLEVRVATDDDELDPELGDDLARLLDLAESGLTAAGLTLVSTTGGEILAARELPDDPAGDRAVRRDALAAAARLHAELVGRPGADARVHVNVCVHAAEVTVRGRLDLEVVGGPLVRTVEWAPRDDVPGACATADAVHGVVGLDLVPGPGCWVTVRAGSPPGA